MKTGKTRRECPWCHHYSIFRIDTVIEDGLVEWEYRCAMCWYQEIRMVRRSSVKVEREVGA